ncbi:MAG: helix-turn-helix domain-containing protein, partial [Thalassobaculaceae bacterium]
MESLLPPQKPAKTSAETINRHIGWSLATRRRALGLSQRELAEASDLSQRQIRDYEQGATPINVDHLFALARAMETPLSSFFEELPQPAPQPFARADRITVSDPQAAELTRAFLSID